MSQAALCNDDKTEFITLLKPALPPRFSASADDITIAMLIGTHHRFIYPVPAPSSHQVLGTVAPKTFLTSGAPLLPGCHATSGLSFSLWVSAFPLLLYRFPLIDPSHYSQNKLRKGMKDASPFLTLTCYHSFFFNLLEKTFSQVKEGGSGRYGREENPVLPHMAGIPKLTVSSSRAGSGPGRPLNLTAWSTNRLPGMAPSLLRNPQQPRR